MKYKKTLFAVTAGTTAYLGANYYRKHWLYRGPDRPSVIIDNDSDIIVRIWKPNAKDQVGHASLQIGDVYLSLWPESGVDLKQKEGIVQSCPATLQTLKEDIFSEDNRNPTEIFEFNYLDRSKMIATIELLKHQIIDNKIGYCLSGRKLKGDDACLNCTTAVFRVLIAGGLESVPIVDRFITSPNQLRDILKHATEKEASRLQTRF